MAATEPTRKPWHSTTDALWASSAVAGDTESTPTDGEIVAGHVNGTGYTSGRANWLWAAVSEWFQKVRDVLFPQHDDSGGHTDVTVTGASGGTKLQITSTSGEASATRSLDIVDADGEMGAWVEKKGDATVRKLDVGDYTSGDASGAVKLQIHTTFGDAGTLEQVQLLRNPGVRTFSVDSDGYVVASGGVRADAGVWTTQNITLGLSPAEFHCASDVAGTNNSSGVYYIEGTIYNGLMNAADTTTRRVMAQEHRLNEGDEITAVTLYANRTAGSITLRLKNKSGPSTIQNVGSCTISSGTGDLTATFTTLPHTVSMGSGYWWEVEIANGGAAGDIRFQRVEVAITRNQIL